MSIRYVLFLLLFAVGELKAQQDPMYSQYMFNLLSVNPAYAGSRNNISVTSIYRKQWLGLDGAPRTAYVSFDMPIKNEKIGLGATVSDDKIGIMHQTNLNLIASYRVKINDYGTLAFGLQGGINQYNADYASVDFSKTNSTNLPDMAFSSSINKIAPNIGAGLYYTTDNFYLGLSAPKLVKNNFSGAYSPSLDFSSFKNRQSRHYFFIAGYVIKLSEQYKLKPSVLIKAVTAAPLGIDLNANLWIRDKIGIGASYRLSNALVALIEIQATPQLRFGYSYDLPVSKLSTIKNGSHEIMIRYEFGFGNSFVQSPRYF